MSTKPQEDTPLDDEPLVMVSPASFECPAYRSPGWVWRAAVSLAQEPLADRQLESSLVRQLAREIRQYGADPRSWGPYPPHDRRQLICEAAEICHWPYLARCLFHSLIVAGVPLVEIAARFHLTPEAIMVYGLIFYDVEAARFWADLVAGKGPWAGCEG